MIDEGKDLFEWDPFKDGDNVEKHGVDFDTATQAFADPHRTIIFDEKHSQYEKRFCCLGKVGGRVLSVRFVHRGEKIRIIGAGFWRKGDRLYEKKDI